MCILWETGVRSLALCGRELPLATKVTPTSPLGDSTLRYAHPAGVAQPSLAKRKWLIKASIEVNLERVGEDAKEKFGKLTGLRVAP